MTVMDVLALMAIFLLRVGVPLLATLVLAFVLHRLDARWQAQANATRHT